MPLLKDRLPEAINFTGSIPLSGLAQFVLLTRSGVSKESRVLEIGCGTLQAAKAIIPSVAVYCGIDPIQWLRESMIEDDLELRRLIERHRPRFDNNDRFDGSVFGLAFDHVLSHSVLSHTSRSQMDLFFKNTSKVMSANGTITASLRLGKDSNAKQWTYPDSIFVSDAAVRQSAEQAGLLAVHQPTFREWYETYRPTEIHDWYTFKKA